MSSLVCLMVGLGDDTDKPPVIFTYSKSKYPKASKVDVADTHWIISLFAAVFVGSSGVGSRQELVERI